MPSVNPSNTFWDILNNKCELHGGARGTARGSAVSVGFIIWGPWLFGKISNLWPMQLRGGASICCICSRQSFPDSLVSCWYSSTQQVKKEIWKRHKIYCYCSGLITATVSQCDISTQLLKHTTTAVSWGSSLPAPLSRWQIQSVLTLCCPGTLILLACSLSCQHTFFTFLPSQTGPVSGSVFPTSIPLSSWGGNSSFVVILSCSMDVTFLPWLRHLWCEQPWFSSPLHSALFQFQFLRYLKRGNDQILLGLGWSLVESRCKQLEI